MRKNRRVAGLGLGRHIAGIVVGLAGMPLHAQTMIQLPAQPLPTALVQLQREAGVNIIAPSDVVAGRKAPALSGRLLPREALDRLLAGTGLVAEQVAPTTFVIKAVPPPAAKPRPPREHEPPVASVTITGESNGRDDGFVAQASRTATRSDTSVADTPLSLQVMNEEFIKSIQAQSVADTLAYVSGTTVTKAVTGRPQVAIRGSFASTKTNGVDDPGPGNSLQVPVAGIERVEVVKGAASILSGAMAPGGTVNVQLKRPTARTVREVTLQAGSYGDLLSAIDLGGTLGADQRLTYRLVVSGERTDDSFGGFGPSRSLYVAPSIGWKSNGTEVVFGYQHQRQKQPATQATILEVTGPLAVSGRTAPLSTGRSEGDNLTLEFKQRLGAVFRFESEVNYRETTGTQDQAYMLLGGEDGIGTYQGVDYEHRLYGFSTDNRLKAVFTTGAVEHTSMAGIAHNRYSSVDFDAPPVFISAPFPMLTAPPVEGEWARDSTREYFKTAYLQHQLAWGRWHVLAGIGHGTSVSRTAGTEQRASKWTPSVGAVYQVTKEVGVYANVLKSYKPGQGVLDDGTLTPPESGKSMEVGIKANLLQNALTATASAYQATLDHSLIYDYNAARFAIGEAYTYRGVEFDLTGRLAPGLNASASYTFTQVTDGADIDKLAMIKHRGNLWLTYDMQGEHLRGWGGGIGLQARGRYRAATFYGNKAMIPGHVKADLTAYYRARSWSVSLGIKNVSDSTFYEESGGARVTLLPGRLAYLTGRYSF